MTDDERRAKRHEYYIANREKINQYTKDWYKAHPGYSAWQARKYRAMHREEVNRKKREYRAKHKEFYREYYRDYRKKWRRAQKEKGADAE